MTKEKQEGKLLDHNYDGIQELDNPLPSWWLNLFYISTVFAILYVGFYWLGPGLGSEERLAKQLDELKGTTTEATAEATPWQESAMTPEALAVGKEIYVSKCASCHMEDGGGMVGPNLVDNYWIHGTGDLDGIYAIIRDGVVSKGMLAWGNVLKPDELAAVTGYVKSLQGTTPRNPKAPQGEKVD
jgi:cytochrome c oxidase cbb3-type subunit 3